MKNFAYSFGVSLISILFIFSLHFHEQLDTMLNRWDRNTEKGTHQIDQIYLEEAVDYHQTEPAFARRPIATFLIKKVATVFNINIGTSFICVNFIALFICGILIFYLTFLFEYSFTIAICSQILFFLSFSILCAFFNTNYTYDEPINYLLIIVSFIAFFKQKHLLFFIFFLLACVSREATHLYIPSILLLVFLSDKEHKRAIYPIGFIMLICIHFALLYFFYPEFYAPSTSTELRERMTVIQFNFQNIGYAAESILSCCLVLFFPLFLLSKNYDAIKGIVFERHLLYSFGLCLLLNTLVVFVATYARESRLFALPLILIYPLLGKYLLKEIQDFSHIKIKKVSLLTVFFILLNIYILYKSHYYINTRYLTSIQAQEFNINGEYLYAIVLVVVLLNIKDLLLSESTKTLS